jgi:hypothetical protein
MEDVVFPNVNDYVQYLSSGQSHFRNPGIPFTDQNGIVEYSRAIWGHFMAKKFGRDAVRLTWEEIRSVPPLQAVDNALQAYGSSFRSAFAEWVLWNYFTGARADTAQYYPEGYLYPLITEMPVDFTTTSRDVSGALKALSSRYYEVMTQNDRVTLALANINLAAGEAKSWTEFPYTYRLNVNKVDDSYKAIGGNVYVKLDVPDQTTWYSWDVYHGSVGSASLVAGSPFPDPFPANGRSSVYVPVSASGPVSATLSVYSSSMDLIYSSPVTSSLQLGRQVFSWNGRTRNNELAQSGIYIYVLELKDQILKGKFAILGN